MNVPVPRISPRTVSPFSALPPCLVLCVPFANAMVATPIMPQQLSAREDVGLDSDEGNWGPIQIAVPAIIGVCLLLILIIALIVWRRRAARDRPYAKYRQSPNDWVSKIEGVFAPWQKRQRVRHSSVLTIAESMRTPGLAVDPRRTHRSASSDSQTPLTMTTYDFVYPPTGESSDSPPPIPKRHHTLRWWWVFGSRPKEVKSEEPSSRWRVDDPDGSSSGHGSHCREEPRARYGGGLEVLHEDIAVDGVIRIGRDFTSIPSTPLTQPENFIEYARPVRSMSPVAEHPQRTVRTPVPATNAARSHPGTPLSSANRGLLPPSYDVSQTHTLVQYPSVENTFRLAHASPSYMAAPPPGRTAVYYSSPRGFHGRELSSDSVVVAAQQPMVATSLY